MEISVLGPLEVTSDGAPVPIPARMQRAVLTMLLLEADRLVPSARIVDLLWPDEPPAQAIAALHTKIAQLRRALDPARAPRGAGSVIVTAPPGYRLDTSTVVIDSVGFEVAVKQARETSAADPEAAVALLDTALAMWRGPAYAEFAQQPYALPTIERLTELRLMAIELRASAILATGDSARAVADLQPHVAAFPLRELARAELARALYADGRQADALATLQEGRVVLREDLGLDPGPELREVERQILGQDTALITAQRAAPSVAPRQRPAEAPRPVRGKRRLAGRDNELTTLADVWSGAGAGRGALVLVTGEAGVGKSAVLAQLAAQAQDEGAATHWANCRDGAAGTPYWPIVTIIRQAAESMDGPGRERLRRLVAPLPTLFPDLVPEDAAPPGVEPTLVQLHLSDALSAVLGVAGHADGRGAGPALMVLDDVHLADPASLALITAIAADIATQPLVLALGLRHGQAEGYPALAEALAALARRDVVRVELAPLSDAAVAELIRSRVREDATSDEVAPVVARAGGNPFFAVELARLAWEGAGSPDGSAAAPLPTAVIDVLRERFHRVPSQTREVLGAAAVAGDPFHAADVASLTGHEVAAVLDLLHPALREGLAVDAGRGRYALGHALIGEALRASLSTARLAQLHRLRGDGLAARHGADAAWAAPIAAHYLEARQLDRGAAAVPWLQRAADHAVGVSALAQLRQLEQSLLSVLEDADVPDTDRFALRAQSRIAYADVWSVGYDSPGVREYCRAIDRWVPQGPARAGDLDLLWVAAMFDIQVGRLDDADRLLARMAVAAEDLRDDTATWLHHSIGSVLRWMQGGFSDSLLHLDAAEAVVRRGAVDLTGSLAFSPLTRISVVRALCLFQLGDTQGSYTQAEAALIAARDEGLGAEGFARRWSLVLALMDGDPDRVAALVHLDLADQTWEQLTYPAAMLRFAEGWLDTQRGDPLAGLVAMRSAQASLAEQSLVAGRSVLLALLAQTLVDSGDATAALDVVDAGLATWERGERYWAPELLRARARALHALGRTTEAADATSEAVRLASDMGSTALLARLDELVREQQVGR